MLGLGLTGMIGALVLAGVGIPVAFGLGLVYGVRRLVATLVSNEGQARQLVEKLADAHKFRVEFHE